MVVEYSMKLSQRRGTVDISFNQWNGQRDLNSHKALPGNPLGEYLTNNQFAIYRIDMEYPSTGFQH